MSPSLVPSSRGDCFADLLGYFHRDDIVAVDILVVQPSVCWSHEILVFYVDEAFGPSNGCGVGPRNWIVHRAAFLRRKRSLILQLEPVNGSNRNWGLTYIYYCVKTNVFPA